jgi:hypothetical protein
MASATTRALLVAAVVVNGLFGSLLDRAFVATPAWESLGVRAWADYSRHADLGAGNLVYPVGGILSWTVILAVAVRYFFFDHAAQRSLAAPISLTVVGALGGIATTIKAAPIMQGVAHLGTDPALRDAFDQFTLWGVYVRGGFFAVSLLASIWGLVEAFRTGRSCSTAPPSPTRATPG